MLRLGQGCSTFYGYGMARTQLMHLDLTSDTRTSQNVTIRARIPWKGALQQLAFNPLTGSKG